MVEQPAIKGTPREGDMIKLTRLGGETFVLNADLIRYVEARPDTFITLTSGERVVVLESMDEVLRRAVAYQQAKHLIPPPDRCRWWACGEERRQATS